MNIKWISFTRTFLTLLLVGMIFFWGCTRVSDSGSDATGEITDSSTEEPQADASFEPETGSEMGTRGLAGAETARMANFSFKDQLPLVYDLVKGDATFLKTLEAYAMKINGPGQIKSEEGIIALLEQRENSIIPKLTPFFENMEEQAFYDNTNALDKELAKIGIRIQTAEAMFVGLGASDMLQQEIKLYGSDAFKWYIKFINADAAAGGGEYPFMNMKPYGDMILAGEQLQELPANPYFDKIKDRYFEALEYFTDIHLVKSPDARQQPSAMVGGINTEFYPYASETQAQSEFVKENENSRYSSVVGRIMENMSEISQKPENIYVIVLEWAKTEDMAKSRVRTHLREGEDVPHFLKIRRGDGTDQYAVSYRFYENSEKASDALDKIQSKFPEAQMIFVSVKGDELYQLGPG